MQSRHYLLSTTLRIFWGAAFALMTAIPRLRQLAFSEPKPVIEGQLGEYVVAGTTGRICLVGNNLEHIQDLIFPDTAIGVKPAEICANEAMFDIQTVGHSASGKHTFLVVTKSGETYAGGHITVLAEPCQWSPTPGFPPTSSGYPTPSPTSTGWVEPNTHSIQQYYDECPVVAGIGASLL